MNDLLKTLYARRRYHFYNRNVEKHSHKDGEVWLIKKLLWFGVSHVKVSKMFKVHSDTISIIEKGKTWQHVQFEPTNKDRNIIEKKKDIEDK